MTREQAKSELMQIYMSLSEEKKQALDVLMAQADGEYISKDKMLMFLNDMRYGIAPDETVADGDERREREAQVDVLDDLMEVVEQMPSVAIPSAEPNTGHWEEVGEEYIQVYDLNGIPSCGDERICSECGFETVFIGEHCSQYKFCPNCGARMVEPQKGANECHIV